jgi:hypothetical protein
VLSNYAFNYNLRHDSVVDDVTARKILTSKPMYTKA